MQKFSACIIDINNQDIKKTLESLEENKDYISEIICTGSNKEYDNIKYLNINSKNEAIHRNACLKEAKSEYILWLAPNIELEDETLEEFNEILEEYENIDIIYPNEVFIDENEEENIKNFNDWYKKNDQLIQSLTLEDYIPNFGVVTKKSKFLNIGGFEDKYNDYCFYATIYKNIKNINFKHSDLSFINHYIYESFIDTSYRSKLLRDILEIYNLKEIFNNLNWENENIAIATAYTIIGDKLFNYYDYLNASNFYRKALISFHNQETLRKLIETYYQMGLFDEALKLLETQDANENIKKEFIEKIENTKKLIQEIEKSVEEGKAAQILISANDITSFYQGAPIYNILGVVFFIKADLENAYRFFYKAATMNPLDNDIINNLIDIAKKLGYEDDVIGLFDRLTK
ncbi:glycosyltransferase family A protein [Nitrosophilus kaiyonis]|uniref:glycosyltransferase family A protein n=1 Tax=Nitrosophilus kaiyonis TaxID=2930200 RepID=UPI0024913774|nr:glycosyltransferase family A protein [Nitrosophilus kaiyonis]